jgi:serine/threonine-protein kinase
MARNITCPRCNEVFATELRKPPAHCPLCSNRITCPKCESILVREGMETSVFRCTHCNIHLAGLETRPLLAGGLTSIGFDDFLVPLPGFRLMGELGRGGMGIVYRAWQESMQREVALKVLPPSMASQPGLLDRVRLEAQVGGRLLGSHLLPVHDIREAEDKSPVIVMPLIDGTDLARILRDRNEVKEARAQNRPIPEQVHPWARVDDRAYLDCMLPLLDQVFVAVIALHREKILHRDIKPSNILVDKQGQAWLSDFGLARLDGQGLGTRIGSGVGTRAYCAPEQARGVLDLDNRADVFSLGATIYQALTGKLPFGHDGPKEGQEPPAPVNARQPSLSNDFNVVVEKALAPDRVRRYQSVQEFQQAWQKARGASAEEPPPRNAAERVLRALKRYPVRIAAAVALLLIGVSALLLPAAGILPSLKNVPATPPLAKRNIMIETTPPGARVALVPLHFATGFPLGDQAIRPKERTPVEIMDVLPGEYLVVVDLEKYGFHEVYRVVPRTDQVQATRPQRQWEDMPDGVVRLPIVHIPKTAAVTQGMVFREGKQFQMGSPFLGYAPVHPWTVNDFFMDPKEVTVGEFRQTAGDAELPPELREPKPADDRPMTWVTYNLALWYAEEVGKRLPEEAEYEFAATNGGTTRFPWGDEGRFTSWPFEKVGVPASDSTLQKPPIYGLYSNVAEWTSTWHHPYPGTSPKAMRGYNSPELQEAFTGARIVRGAPRWAVEHADGNLRSSDDSATELDPRFRMGYFRDQRRPGLGFRCVRSAAPRFMGP